MADTTPDPDVLSAEDAAARLRLRKVDTLHRLAALGEVPFLQRSERRRLYSWTALYEMAAGPGVPAGKILTAAEVGAWLGLSASQVRRSSAEPGTPERIPGHKFGSVWRYAEPAIALALRGGNRPAVPAVPASGHIPPS